jgi:zinc protease
MRFMKMRRTAVAWVLFGAQVFLLGTLISILWVENVKAMEVLKLKNGLTGVLEKRPGTGVVALQVWVKVGSRYEDDRIAGITHFIEHLIFKGTEVGESYEIAPKIEALGGSINAFTSYDNTVYHIVIPKDSFEEGFKLLIHSVNFPAFPDPEIQKEKKVVLEEIKMGDDDPQRKLFKELFSASFPGHPYSRPVIGYAETVSAASRADIIAYYKSHYTPDNMSIVVVGDFDEKKVSHMLTEQFSGLGSDKPAIEKAKGSTTINKGDKQRVVEMNITESYVSLSYPVGSFLHPDTPALDVLSEILSDGESSRLQANLKHKRGIVTGCDTYLFAPQEKGMFVVTATFKGRDYGTIVKGFDEELEKLAKDGPETWEMEKAINNVQASYIFGAETVQGKARLVGNLLTLSGDVDYSDKYLSAVAKVTPADIKRVMATYIIDKSKRATVALLPKSSTDTATTPPVPKKSTNPVTINLDNGLRFVYNKNTASPSFSFMIGFIGGLKEEKPGMNGSFNVLSSMLLRGTKDLDAHSIARKIDLLAGNISPVSGRNVFGLSGKFLSKDFKTALVLLKDLLRTTVIRDDELKKVKDEVLSDIRRRDDDPAQYTFTKMSSILYEGHPYSFDHLGSEKDVIALSVDAVEGLYRSYVTPQNTVLAISGNVDQKVAEEMVKSLFSDWKGTGRDMKKTPFSLSSPKDVAIDRDIVQTHMIFGFVGPGLIDQDRYPVEVLDAVLSGMGGRIHKKLREENPYAYAVTFFNQPAYEVGAMGIYIGTDKVHAADVDRLVRAEITDIRTNGLNDNEVTDSKRYLLGNHYIRMQTNSSIASSMCLDTIYGLGPNFYKVWPETIQKVTREDVNAIAKKYLVFDRMVKIAVGPKGEKSKN